MASSPATETVLNTHAVSEARAKRAYAAAFPGKNLSANLMGNALREPRLGSLH
jgi:hypothetical protein